MIGKTIYSFIHPNEYSKFTNVFSNTFNNTGINNAKHANLNKFKSFPCQMLIKNSKNSSHQTIDVDSSKIKSIVIKPFL